MMERRSVPGSFRDPSGRLFQHDGTLYREVRPVYRDNYELLMSSGLYQSAVDAGRLIPHEEVDPASIASMASISSAASGGEPAYKILRPEFIPFISYPYEWCFSQLKDAALLTLALQKRALRKGMWLKDASAYNVQFHRGRPVFIDTLSFEAYPEGKPWVAYQQFCKHFLAPLALMAYTHVDLLKLLRVNIDGVPLDVASRLLPTRTRFRFSLLSHIHLHSRAQIKHSDTRETQDQAGNSGGAGTPPRARSISKTGLLGLMGNLESAVRRLDWTPAGTEWGNYYSDTNYSDGAQKHKMRTISGFLEGLRPSSTWDLGANTGLFSRLASDLDIPTLAFDIDPAAVEKNYRQVREKKESLLLPLVMDLTNPSSGIGWDGDERSSLFDRGPADVAMALALVHHLAISNNVPLDRVAQMLGRLCRFLIIEFVPKSDSQVRRLLATREDIFPDYTQKGFEEAFLERFHLRERVAVEESERVLYLLETR